MARAAAPPLTTLRDLFVVRGAFAPSSVHATEDTLDCVGVLTLPGGARRKVILVVAAPTRALQGLLATKRYSYGCGPARVADAGDAFGGEVDAAVVPVLERLVRHERRFAALWPLAARAWAAHPAPLDVPESAMGGPVPPELVRAAAAERDPVLDVGIHLRSGCLQRCAFCRREPQRFDAADHDADLATVEDLVRRVVRPARRRGLDVRVRIEADDLAGHRRLEDIATLLAPQTAFGLHLVVPPNRLADPSTARRFAGLESVTLTLFGCTPRTHDAVAGRPGAFLELLRAARNLDAAGTVPLILSAVLTAAGVGELGGILDVARLLRGRPTVSALFADCAMHHLRLAAIAPDLGALRRAFSAEQRRILFERVALQDFPVCALPPALRALNDTNRVLRRDDYPALPACAPCVHRPRCCGVPRGYLDAHGDAHLAPEKHAQRR
jgi:hypothetical protein